MGDVIEFRADGTPVVPVSNGAGAGGVNQPLTAIVYKAGDQVLAFAPPDVFPNAWPWRSSLPDASWQCGTVLVDLGAHGVLVGFIDGFRWCQHGDLQSKTRVILGDEPE